MVEEEMAEEEKLALDYSYKVEPLMDVGIDNTISVYCRQDVEQAYLDGYLAGLKAGRPKQKNFLKRLKRLFIAEKTK